jgi:hypothetical protein
MAQKILAADLLGENAVGIIQSFAGGGKKKCE